MALKAYTHKTQTYQHPTQKWFQETRRAWFAAGARLVKKQFNVEELRMCMQLFKGAMWCLWSHVSFIVYMPHKYPNLCPVMLCYKLLYAFDWFVIKSFVVHLLNLKGFINSALLCVQNILRTYIRTYLYIYECCHLLYHPLLFQFHWRTQSSQVEEQLKSSNESCCVLLWKWCFCNCGWYYVYQNINHTYICIWYCSEIML